MKTRHFGHIPDYPEGSWFATRAELSEAGLHRPLQAGISGSALEGCDSIVLSGGYEDDKDFGNEIWYTGHGGRDPETGKQVANQTLTRGNLALAYNKAYGLPVRVIRGARHISPYSPEEGYRYDGLYMVESYTRKDGEAGFYVWHFHLLKIDSTQLQANRISEEETEYVITPRQKVTAFRVIRDTEQARRIKALYHYRCQICGTALQGPAGPYAEAAHIRPLGMPHLGPDTEDNILCLCPNHHVLFDLGSIAINDDLSLLGESGRLMMHARHQISVSHIRYHRTYCFVADEEPQEV